ncbi:MAG: twitching motility protein, partial [Acidobacteria bacterium]
MNQIDINRILESMLSYRENISDLNFSVGRSPQVEVSGQLMPVPIKGMERLSPYQTEMIALSLMAQDREIMRKLTHTGSTD